LIPIDFSNLVDRNVSMMTTSLQSRRKKRKLDVDNDDESDDAPATTNTKANSDKYLAASVVRNLVHHFSVAVNDFLSLVWQRWYRVTRSSLRRCFTTFRRGHASSFASVGSSVWS
jgi:hypothetical protein